jgi:hypothetical protein
MTQTSPPSAHRTAAVSHTAAQKRPAPGAEPPRQQAETRAARDRFAARLDRDPLREAGKNPRSEGNAAADSRDRVQARDEDQSDRFGGGPDNGSDTESDVALAQAPSTLLGAHGPSSVGAIGAPITPLIDPALIARMAAQIAETWPSAASEAVQVQFPQGSLITGALLSRLPDGSMAIRLTGLDPQVTAVQGVRLQRDLAAALTRRRLRIGAMQFEDERRVQRGRTTPGAGTSSAIDRVV